MNIEQTPLPETLPAPLSAVEEETPTEENKNVWTKVGIIAGAVVVIALVVVSVILLLQSGTDTTAKVRDIFIIFMALEFLIIGLALVILIVQLARLINLLQNEVKPILDSTNETANTLRGTTQFLSDHLVEPVIKLNEYLASLQSILKVFRSKGR
ncbi:MAG: hypothetical protein U9O54_08070 [Chloroflexota bacterium]|nr:hypothetical protein [Chloroflexota bacterium]